MRKKSTSGLRRREVRLDDEVVEALEAQRQAFKQKFGREPGPEDPVFFDPDAIEPKPLPTAKADQQVIEALEAAGTDPALIHVFKLTGLLLTAETWPLVSREARNAYLAALDEFGRLKGSPDRP
jgi:hypothetical protein